MSLSPARPAAADRPREISYRALDAMCSTLAVDPAYRHPRRVFFLDRMPPAGANKIDHPLLRRMVADGPYDAQTTGASHG